MFDDDGTGHLSTKWPNRAMNARAGQRPLALGPAGQGASPSFRCLALAACLILALLPGCRERHPSPDLQDADSAAMRASLHSEEEVATIREAIEARGGTLRCDSRGQPIEIDLTVGRGSADAVALNAILDCPDLRVLRIRAGQLAGEDLARIETLANIEELAFLEAAVTDQGLANLVTGLPSLRRLTLRNTPKIGDRGISRLAALPHLTHLALIELTVTGSAVEAIADFPAVVSLDLRMCNNIHADQLAVLAKAPRLRELKLGGHGINDAAMAVVATLPQLESLTVEDASVGAEGLNQLATNRQAASRIHTLAFARCSALTDDALGSLSSFGQLRRLTMRDTPVTGDFLRSLASPERLELLALNQTFLTDEAFDAIAACQALKRLELAQSYLTPQAMEKIATLSNLRYLNLSECGLNDQLLESLSGLTFLTTLVVNGNPDVSPEAVARASGQSSD